MTLKRRIRRLETSARTTRGAQVPTKIVLAGVAPSPAGPKLVSLALLAPRGGDSVHLEREPGEDEAAFRARFDAVAESVGNVTQNNGELQQ